MSQSEDYLDGLLNSINKAKTDAMQVQENAMKKQQQATESRKAVAPDEDFFTATGIDASQAQTKSSHPYLRKVLSEEDFLRQFEEELESEDVDLFISNFEQEIDDEERLFQETGELPESESVVGSLLDNIDKAVNKAKKDLDAEEDAVAENENGFSDDNNEAMEDASEESLDEDVDLSFDISSSNEEEEPDSGEGSDELSLKDILEDDEPEIDLAADDTPIELPDDDEIDLSNFIEESDEEAIEESSEDDDFGLSLDDIVEDSSDDEPLDESLKEFMPDDMDALDEAQYGDGDEPDLSGEGDLDLDNLLEGGDEDLLDIQSLLSGDEEGASEGGDIDETAEEAEEEEEEEDGKGKKKKKKKKEKKAKGEKGEKTPNPIIQKLLLILFGPPDEDEIAEAEEAAKKKAGATVEITYDEDGNPIIPEGAEEDPKEKKKRLKEEKKAAKEAAKKEKEAAKKEKAKDKPAKPPKPKKEKKPKEPDNSPKIPISIIATFLVLSISIIGVVMVGMTFTGIRRHMSQAEELFEAGNYIAAYEKLNGFDLSDEDVALLRNQARTLADLQLCQQEYEAFIAYEQYNYALDSLIIGVGRYEKYKDDAAEYGIADQYDAYGSTLIAELSETFGLSEEEALAIYNQPNRHYYTIELRKVLRSLGLPDL